MIVYLPKITKLSFLFSASLELLPLIPQAINFIADFLPKGHTHSIELYFYLTDFIFNDII